MDVESLIDRFRTEVHDTANPYLWGQDEVINYVNDAQEWYCRETGGIADSSSAGVTEIPLTTGQKFAPVDSRILKIRHAQRRSDNKEVDLWNFEDAQFRPMYDNTAYYAPHKLTLDDTQGVVSKIITGMEQYKVRCVYIPAVDDVIDCIIYRLPLVPIAEDVLGNLEIPAEDHILLLDGMKALAYAKQDAETFDKGKQAEFEAKFLAKCAEAQYKREKREHKYRTVRYGGI